MNKKLVKVDGGLAIVIDLALLAVIGAEGATELDLTTDGSRLILTPIPGRPAAPVFQQRKATPSPQLEGMTFDRDDPKASHRAIQELQERFGFTPEHFTHLHHFGPKASLKAHINYCMGTSRFRSETNAVVNERLNHCLRLRRDGAGWNEAIESAVATHPMPPSR